MKRVLQTTLVAALLMVPQCIVTVPVPAEPTLGEEVGSFVDEAIRFFDSFEEFINGSV